MLMIMTLVNILIFCVIATALFCCAAIMPGMSFLAGYAIGAVVIAAVNVLTVIMEA